MTLIDDVRNGRLPSPTTRRAVRLAAGVTQRRMAQELNIDRSTLIRWENGTHEPRGEARLCYARLLDELRKVS